MAESGRLDELQRKFEEHPSRYFAPLANELRKAGRVDRAIELCRAYLPHQPGHLSGYIVYGQSLFDAQRIDEARAIFHQALRIDPENIIALRQLGDIARLQGDYAVARQWYHKVQDVDPRNEHVATHLTQLDEAETDALSKHTEPTEMMAEESSEEVAYDEPVYGEPSSEEPSQEATSHEASSESTPAVSTPSFDPSLETSPSDARSFETSDISSFETSSFEMSSFDAAVEPDSAPEPEPVPDTPPVPPPADIPPVATTPATSTVTHSEMPYEVIREPQGEIQQTPAQDEPTTPASAVNEPVPQLHEDPYKESYEEPHPFEAPIGFGFADDAHDAGDKAAAPINEPFVTETMAELYLQQGLTSEALTVYRQLAYYTGDARLQDTADQLEQQLKYQLEHQRQHEEPQRTDSRAAQETVHAFFARIGARTPRDRELGGVAVADAAPSSAPANSGSTGLDVLFPNSALDPADAQAATSWANAYTTPS